jgi:glutamyl-tRNA synthetase
MTVVTRFAPSPTGFLHIGGARTALFNWLFSRHHKGIFRLRIEDTDRARSTPEAVAAILDGLSWLGLDWDGETIYQFQRMARHAAVAHEMVAAGRAYLCYCTPEELEAMRNQARADGRPPRYDGRWRERDPKEAPPGIKPSVRIKAPREGERIVNDLVQGEIRVANTELDDMVLLRGDGTPTYMLSVVVDDHDMQVTHVIRGHDHLTNTFRQLLIYDAMGWRAPEFAHIPLIHGADGAKLSKRHGALGVDAYRDLGLLPEAMRNYLLRLGWSHGDEEIISDAQAVEWFDLDSVGRSPARFDMARLVNLNAHYIRNKPDDSLTELVLPRLGALEGVVIDAAGKARLTAGMAGLKARARTLIELAEAAAFYLRPRPIRPDAKAAALLAGDAKTRLARLAQRLTAHAGPWAAGDIEAVVNEFATAEGIKLGQVAQPVRAALTGSSISPPIFEVMAVFGRDESLARLAQASQS